MPPFKRLVIDLIYLIQAAGSMQMGFQQCCDVHCSYTLWMQYVRQQSTPNKSWEYCRIMADARGAA